MIKITKIELTIEVNVEAPKDAGTDKLMELATKKVDITDGQITSIIAHIPNGFAAKLSDWEGD